ncbi:hypothetical protein AXG93_4225s1460 [Marchantia polymorpha subsp. ruderalis]|uniref:Uncharacterized protein n=1 Tax=Marchantia polymorpha subsp. ruderalis TaxID=1480154 RepID=A0A176WTB6_MARPO|nr:hypothetical protein AXG93_4225s1460 [Marchantia polymorpha subsp. ruderalis]
MGHEIEASEESSTHRAPSIEGSQPERRSLDNGDRQLQNSAGANETTVGGFTPLHHAAAMGQKDVVDAILLEGNRPNPKVEAATSEGFTALHFAAYGGHETIVTSLLHWYGKNPTADVNARDKLLCRTALHYAVGGGHQRVVKELIKFPGIDICPEDSVQNLTPLLMEAARRIFYTFKLYRDVKVGVKTRFDHLWYLAHGVLVSSPRQLLCLPFRFRRTSYEIPLDQNDFSRQRKLAILAIHVYAIVAMTIYSLVS